MCFTFDYFVSLRYIRLGLGGRVSVFLGGGLPTLLDICSFFFGCFLCLSFPLVLGALCGSDCISSRVHLFTFLLPKGPKEY